MKNREKYREEILNYKRKGFCDNFIEPNILKPLGINCSEISCVQCKLISDMWLEEEYKEPEVDWGKVAVDTPILVRESGSDRWVKRYFAKYENGKVYAWSGGQTSWSGSDYDGCMYDWDYAKLADIKEELHE
ncbi:hypothetical protein [Anaerostipes faecalis]|uniref:hypothetical protein n=1 Tax=Anaerostipes faecalis TaxID=2738446 RepID=UPI001C1E0FB3|nr:hypothetical protein [Anaerostipes faecalis]